MEDQRITQDIQEAARAALTIREHFPSLFMGLNSAQYRAFEDMYLLTNSGLLPDLNSVEFANGVGKSHLMILDFIGWCMGEEYLDSESYPAAALKYWRSVSEKRDTGKMSLRLVCTADDMKAGGSVYELLKQVFPWAKAVKQDNNGVYRQIDIMHPTIPGINNHIAIKTFDQPEDKHSGSTCDRIWVNENLPEGLMGETLGRTRGGGNIVQFATILDYSTHLDELEDSVTFVMRRSRGHIYENCIGEEVTDEMAAEVFTEIGVVLKKNKDKKGYNTGGVLHRAKIESMIEGWMRACPHQVQARKTGKPIASGGKIHPSYNDQVHQKPRSFLSVIPDKYPVVQVVDPHPARPDAAIWAVILPTNRLHIAKEWPSFDGFGYYEQIKEKRFTVSQKCEMWKEIEARCGFEGHIVARIGDPNRFKEPNADNFEQLSALYSAHGFDFYLGVNDNFELGIERVNEYLYYDQLLFRMHPEDPAAQARLTVSEDCINTNRALRNFSRKVSRDRTAPISEKVDEKYGCFAGVVRYLVMWHANNPFAEIVVDQNRKYDDDRIREGRVPKRFRETETKINLHGRKLLETARGR